ncbi:MAG: RNA polymerase factor sigma-54 [Fibrobacter sp.]|nr:RNA polymerase factor sigma-54 [Fibrobacter sp.]
MDLGMNIAPSQRLETALTAQLLQSVTILQKTSLELETAIKEELESNPLLELDDTVPEEEREVRDEELPESGAELMENPDSEQEYDFSDNESLDDTEMVDRGVLDGARDNELDYERYLEDGTDQVDAPFKDLNASPNDSDDNWDRPIKDVGKSLQDTLRDQLLLWSGTHELLKQLSECGCTEERFKMLVEYLIDSLDESGFLPIDQSHIPISIPEDRYISEIESMLRGEIHEDDLSIPVREALHVLKGFTPRGIGARDKRECFLMQAYDIPNFPELSIAILEKCYDDLVELRYAKIAKTLGVTVKEIQDAVLSLSRLNPNPGFQLSSGGVQTIAADMRIVEKKGHFEVEVVRSSTRVRINQTYKAIIQDKRASKTDKDFVRTHLNKANVFIKALDDRYSTMEKVMRAILRRQKEFFAHGPAFLKPMVLQDIAEDVNRDVSIVNRVTNGKYVDTPFGIYELKRFFTNGVKQGDTGDSNEVSSAAILEAIKKLVDEEDKSKPLSDDAIAEALSQQGIEIKRRTVAKYRDDKLKILPARLRKR